MIRTARLRASNFQGPPNSKKATDFPPAGVATGMRIILLFTLILLVIGALPA